MIQKVLLFLTMTLAGCLWSESKFTPPASEEAFIELAKKVAEWRELPLDRQLRLEIQAPRSEKIPAQLVPTSYYGSAPIAQIDWVYKSIGLLPNGVDLAGALAEYERIRRLIDYSRASATISISPEAARLDAAFEKIDPSAAREIPTVIGIAQALQEQCFAWREKIESSMLEDRRSALGALAAGDALFTAVSRAARPDSRKLSVAQLHGMLQVAADIDKLGARLPDFLRAKATFAYREGSQFVYWAYAAAGWPGVNGLYEHPPNSTAQILHPEKYFIQREDPLRFFPAALLRRLKDLSIVEQSLGELLVRTLLESAQGAKGAADTAAGWRGDQLFSFQDNSLISTFWFSSWRDEQSTARFLDGYRKVLENRHRVSFESIDKTRNGTLIASASDGRSWLLQLRGSVVLLLQSGSGRQLTQLADEAWTDLEIEPEPTAVRFEMARRSVNFR
jgi:hypothetical protein